MQAGPRPQVSPEIFTEIQAKAMEAFSAFAQANQRVLQELVDLSATTAKEGVRAYAELQSAAVDATRDAQSAGPRPRDLAEALPPDPFTWFQKSLLSAVDVTQRGFRLLEANANVVTRSAERLQASAERTGKEIQDALTAYLARMKSIYGLN